MLYVCFIENLYKHKMSYDELTAELKSLKKRMILI